MTCYVQRELNAWKGNLASSHLLLPFHSVSIAQKMPELKSDAKKPRSLGGKWEGKRGERNKTNGKGNENASKATEVGKAPEVGMEKPLLLALFCPTLRPGGGMGSGAQGWGASPSPSSAVRIRTSV